VQTILGPLSWTATGEPNGKFLLGQWQSGKAQVVAPAEAATSQTVVNPKPDWK
jgi:branched-chain amino acid transport system substrate-binding protein